MSFLDVLIRDKCPRLETICINRIIKKPALLYNLRNINNDLIQKILRSNKISGESLEVIVNENNKKGILLGNKNKIMINNIWKIKLSSETVRKAESRKKNPKTILDWKKIFKRQKEEHLRKRESARRILKEQREQERVQRSANSLKKLGKGGNRLIPLGRKKKKGKEMSFLQKQRKKFLDGKRQERAQRDKKFREELIRKKKMELEKKKVRKEVNMQWDVDEKPKTKKRKTKFIDKKTNQKIQPAFDPQKRIDLRKDSGRKDPDAMFKTEKKGEESLNSLFFKKSKGFHGSLGKKIGYRAPPRKRSRVSSLTVSNQRKRRKIDDFPRIPRRKRA